MGKSSKLKTKLSSKTKTKSKTLRRLNSKAKYGPIPIPELERQLFDTNGTIIQDKPFKFNIDIPDGYTLVKSSCDKPYYVDITESYGPLLLSLYKSDDTDALKKPCITVSYMDGVIDIEGLMLNADKSCKTCVGSSYMMVAYCVLQLLIKHKAIKPVKMQLTDIATTEINTTAKPYTTKAILQMLGIQGTTYNYNLTSYNLAVKYRSFYEAYGFVPAIKLVNSTGTTLEVLEPYSKKYVTYFAELVKKRKLLLDRKFGDYAELLKDEETYNAFWKVAGDDTYIFYLWSYSRFKKIINSAINKLSSSEKYKADYTTLTLKDLIYKSVKTENNNNKPGLSMAHDLLPINSLLSSLIAIFYYNIDDTATSYYYPARNLIPKILAIYNTNGIDVYESYYSIVDVPLAN